jgi:hypothetical protein
MSTFEKRSIRCAIYTRKSSEEGLEQSFNSLDAQREACQAYRAEHSVSQPGSKAPLLSGRSERRVTQREISYPERNSLVED